MGRTAGSPRGGRPLVIRGRCLGKVIEVEVVRFGQTAERRLAGLGASRKWGWDHVRGDFQMV